MIGDKIRRAAKISLPFLTTTDRHVDRRSDGKLRSEIYLHIFWGSVSFIELRIIVLRQLLLPVQLLRIQAPYNFEIRKLFVAL